MTDPRDVPVRPRPEAFYVYAFLLDFLPFIPVLIAYQRSRGLSFTEITLLQAAYYVSFLFFEVPTGALADRIGLRAPLVAAGFAMALGALLCVRASTFSVFLAASLLLAIGKSLASGADSAYLYALIGSSGEEAYRKAEGRAQGVRLLSFIAAAVSGGLLATRGDTLPFWAASVGLCAAAVSALLLPRPTAEEDPRGGQSSVWRQTLATVRHVLAEKALLRILAFTALAFTFIRVSSLILLQPFLIESGLGKEWYGFSYGVFALVAALAAFSLHRIPAERYGSLVAFTVLVSPLTLLAIGGIGATWALALFALPALGAGCLRPLSTSLFQRHAQPGQRATLLSIDSLVSRVVFAGVTCAAGFVLDRRGVHAANGVVGVLGLLVALPVLLFTAPLRRPSAWTPSPPTAPPPGSDPVEDK